MSVSSSASKHSQELKKSQEILLAARQKASKTRSYVSHQWREWAKLVFRERTEGLTAHDWQLDIAEALELGVDTLAIAATGKGKTTPFVLPLLASTSKIKKIIVVVPLLSIQKGHVQSFERLGVRSIAVNSETWNKDLHKEIEAHQYQAIITTPEMLFRSHEFFKLVVAPKFSQTVAAAIIDECHVIPRWGQDFRQNYNDLAHLRAMLPSHVPFLATSATLTPTDRVAVAQVLLMKCTSTYYLNLGNDRPNITYRVKRMRSGHEFNNLDWVVGPENRNIDGTIKKTMVFVDKVALTIKIMNHICQLVPEDEQDLISIYHAHRSPFAKDEAIKRFTAGTYRILVTTEAAGMGVDVPDIDLVVQFKVPNGLSTWIQRAGRAARGWGTWGEAVMLVEEAVFKKRKTKKKKEDRPKIAPSAYKDWGYEFDGESVVIETFIETAPRRMLEEEHEAEVIDEEEHREDDVGPTTGVVSVEVEGEETVLQYIKEIEKGLRLYIESKVECRHNLADSYFDNPPREEAPTGSCYDICEVKLTRARQALTQSTSIFHCNATEFLQLSRPTTPMSANSSTDNGSPERIESFTQLFTTLPSTTIHPSTLIQDTEDLLSAEVALTLPSTIIHPSTPIRNTEDLLSAEVAPTPSDDVNANGKRPMTTRPRAAPRTGRQRGAHNKILQCILNAWRWKTCLHEFPFGSLDHSCFLIDRHIVTLAAFPIIQTVDDLKNSLKPAWPFVDSYGPEVLQLIQQTDAWWYGLKQRKKDEEKKRKKEEKEEKLREKENMKVNGTPSSSQHRVHQSYRRTASNGPLQILEYQPSPCPATRRRKA